MAAVAWGSKTEPPLAGTSTSRTLQTPGSTITGQLVVAVIKVNGAAVTIAAPGYTVTQVHVGGAEEHTLAALYRVAAKAGEQPIEVTWGGASRYNAGLAFRVANINPTLNPPVEVATTKANEAASKSLTFPSATAGRKEMLSILIGGENIEGEAGSTPPAGWTSRQSFSGGGAPFVATKSLSGTGATGEVAATLTTARATTAIQLLVAGEEEEAPPEVPVTKLGTVAAGVAETDTVALVTTAAVKAGETVILAYASNGNWPVKSVSDPKGLLWGKDEEISGSSPHFGVVSIWSAKAPEGLPSGSTITLKLSNPENSGKAAMAVAASNISPVLPWVDRVVGQKGTGTGWSTGTTTKESTRAKTLAITAAMTRTTNSLGRSFTTAPALEVYDFRSANFTATMSCLSRTTKGKAAVAGTWWPESFDYVAALALYRVVEEPEPPPPPEPAIPRLYSAAGPLNSPIPANPHIHPDSAAIVAYLVENELDRKFSFTAGYNSHTDYNHPLYFATESDPKYPCLFSDTFGDQKFGGYEVHVPAGALPAAGGDGHMGVVQPDGQEVDFLNYEGVVEGKIHAHWGGRSRFEGFGVDVGPDGGGVAARYALGFGAVTAKELEEEAPMKQALFAVVPGTNGMAAYPAYGPAGSGGPMSLACGLRLFLDYTEEEIERLPAVGWQKAVIRRLKRYGAFIGDTGGDFIKCEADAPYAAKSEESPLVKLAKVLGIPEQVGEEEIYKGTFKYRLDGIVDWSRLKVLAPMRGWETVRSAGDLVVPSTRILVGGEWVGA